MALSEKEKHVGRYYDAAKRRAKEKGIPFNLTIEYLRSIASDYCPIFHTPLEWGRSKRGRGKMKPNGAQLDRIIPELGYVIGNVAFISHRANRIKDNGTMQEHYDIADWIWNHLYANENTTAPLPKRTNLKGADNTEHRIIYAPRDGQICDDANHHSRTIQGQNANHSPITDSTNSLGHRSKEVGASEAFTRIEDHGIAEPEIVRLEFGRRYLFDKP